VLATAVATLLPFAADASILTRLTRLTTGLINLCVGIAIGTLVGGAASRSLRPAGPRPGVG
jgi:hypothetical protein